MLVLAVAAVALGVVGFGLARATTVLALFDRTTLGIDMVKFAIYGSWSGRVILRGGVLLGAYQYDCSHSRGDL